MGAILFVSGLVAALVGDTINNVNRAKGEIIEQNLKYNNYAPSVQVSYDCHQSLDSVYNAVEMARGIQEDWPGIQLHEAIKLAHMAIAKDMMERETTYKYHVPDQYHLLDLSKYIKDEYKHENFYSPKYAMWLKREREKGE